MDRELFEAACRRARESQGGGGIGTLGEGVLHAALKYYCEPDESRHERRVAGMVADIQNEAGIVEIQTRNFQKLWKKLPRLLEAGPVTLVHPLPATKWLIWVDPETGECLPPRKSPKRGRPTDACGELHRIKEFLPRLEIRLVLVDMEEYRLRNGWSRDGKRGSTRRERLPLALQGEVWLGGAHGWDALLPEELPTEFTSRDYAKAARLSLTMAQRGLAILREVGAARQVGKRGRLVLHRTETQQGRKAE